MTSRNQNLSLPDLNPSTVTPMNMEKVNKKSRLELKVFLNNRHKLAVHRDPEQFDLQHQINFMKSLEHASQSNIKWLSFYEISALLGDAASIYKLAQIYHGMRDISMAVFWYEKGVVLGHPGCMDMLGYIFFTGLNGYRNDNIAINFYQQAVIMNYLPSYINIGVLYIRNKDYTKALYYFTEAFKLGSTIASYYIAIMYFKGLFVERSYNHAIHHLMRCFNTFDEETNTEYQILYLLGHLNKELCNYELALKYFNICASSDHIVAVFELGKMYLHGIGVKKSKLHALKFFERSASFGYVPAIKSAAMLAMMLPIYTSAFKWNEIIAIQLGDAKAMFHLSQFYDRGIGTKRNYVLSYKWLLMAAEFKMPDALSTIALCYMTGRGFGVTCVGQVLENESHYWLSPDYLKARYFYEASADLGFVSSIYNLGMLHWNGLGVNINVERGRQYMQRAANSGHRKAVAVLKEWNYKSK